MFLQKDFKKRKIFLIELLMNLFLVPVRRPGGRLARQVGRVQLAALPRILRLPPRKLRQGPQPLRQGAHQNSHRRQLAGLIHISPRKCRESPFFVGCNEKLRLAKCEAV